MKRTGLGFSAAVFMVAGAGLAAEEHDRGIRSQMGPETRAEAQARAGQLFDKLDLNHDGKLDQADRVARMNSVFDSMDTNHDGVVSRSEFAEAHEHMMGPGHGSEAMAMHGGSMGRRGYDHREMGGLVMLIMQRADPGHTGAVTRDAFVAAALSLFDQADTNHDAVLTPAEHRAFAQAMRQQMHADWQKHGHDMSPPPPVPN